MNKRSIALIYTVLIIVLIASSVFLAYEVKHYINTREDDPLAGVRDTGITEEELIREAVQVRQEERESIFFTFSRTTAYTPLATPVPIPTSTPVPPPSPTPIIPAQGWKIVSVFGQNVSLRRYDDTTHTKRIGQVFEDPAPQNEDFEVLDATAGPNPRVKVRTTVTKTEGYITERHQPGSSGQQRRQ